MTLRIKSTKSEGLPFWLSSSSPSGLIFLRECSRFCISSGVTLYPGCGLATFLSNVKMGLGIIKSGGGGGGGGTGGVGAATTTGAGAE